MKLNLACQMDALYLNWFPNFSVVSLDGFVFYTKGKQPSEGGVVAPPCEDTLHSVVQALLVTPPFCCLTRGVQ